MGILLETAANLPASAFIGDGNTSIISLSDKEAMGQAVKLYGADAVTVCAVNPQTGQVFLSTVTGVEIPESYKLIGKAHTVLGKDGKAIIFVTADQAFSTAFMKSSDRQALYELLRQICGNASEFASERIVDRRVDFRLVTTGKDSDYMFTPVVINDEPVIDLQFNGRLWDFLTQTRIVRANAETIWKAADGGNWNVLIGGQIIDIDGLEPQALLRTSTGYTLLVTVDGSMFVFDQKGYQMVQPACDNQNVADGTKGFVMSALINGQLDPHRVTILTYSNNGQVYTRPGLPIGEVVNPDAHRYFVSTK